MGVKFSETRSNGCGVTKTVVFLSLSGFTGRVKFWNVYVVDKMFLLLLLFDVSVTHLRTTSSFVSTSDPATLVRLGVRLRTGRRRGGRPQSWRGGVFRPDCGGDREGSGRIVCAVSLRSVVGRRAGSRCRRVSPQVPTDSSSRRTPGSRGSRSGRTLGSFVRRNYFKSVRYVESPPPQPTPHLSLRGIYERYDPDPDPRPWCSHFHLVVRGREVGGGDRYGPSSPSGSSPRQWRARVSSADTGRLVTRGETSPVLTPKRGQERDVTVCYNRRLPVSQSRVNGHRSLRPPQTRGGRDGRSGRRGGPFPVVWMDGLQGVGHARPLVSQ